MENSVTPDPKEPKLHPNDKQGHNAEDFDLIMENLRQEAASLKISGVDQMDRNELMTEIYRARNGITYVPEGFDPRENNTPRN